MTTAAPNDTERDGATAVGIPVNRTVRLLKMRQTSEDNYIGDGDYRMQREYGLTPNCNDVGGRWVLRGPEAKWIDCDKYRYDLLARHGFDAA